MLEIVRVAFILNRAFRRFNHMLSERFHADGKFFRSACLFTRIYSKTE